MSGVEYRLENQMERAVFQMIDDLTLLDTQNRFCYCGRFRLDVAALALNSLQPRYVTSLTGSVMVLNTIQEDEELKTEVCQAVSRALEKVAASPRCQEAECGLVQPTWADEVA